MKINELFNDVCAENLKYEFKSVLNQDNPIKWAKTLVAFANNDGGILFVGVSDNGDAFGLTLQDIDKTKNLVAKIHQDGRQYIRLAVKTTEEDNKIIAALKAELLN